MSDNEVIQTKNTVVKIWPDFMELALGIILIVALFYYTGLEVSFEKNGTVGIYMEFDEHKNTDIEE